MLAVRGGQPVAEMNQWPRWPIYGDGIASRFEDVLRSHRWSPCGFWTGRSTLVKTAAEKFAAYNGVAHCVFTASGSSSLVIALEALDAGAGDEVIVPGLTWVAPATAVANVNAVPVLVDVDPDTCCLDINAVKAAITPRTRAIIAVHLYCSMVDMDALRAVAQAHDIRVIEDCAQSHGSRWGDQNAGTIGDIGVFSFTHGKPLTSGEGGAAITASSALHERLMQLHLDGRRYGTSAPHPGQLGHMELEEVGSLLGTNYAMTDFQAALLIDGLSRLDDQNLQRAKNAQQLDQVLEGFDGLRPISRPAGVTAQTYYHYFMHYDPAAFAGRSAAAFSAALSAELGFWCHPSYPPLNKHRLYSPLRKRRYAISPQHVAALDPSRFSLPNAERIHARSIVFHHSMFLGGAEGMGYIEEALNKLRKYADQIPPAPDEMG